MCLDLEETMNPALRIVVLGVLICSAAALGATPEPLPTASDAHQQFNDGKFRDAIKSISKIAASREWQAKQFDKHDLLLLKGEAHLRLKETIAAAAAFDAASRETSDKPAIALDHTTSVLIKKCIGTR